MNTFISPEHFKKMDPVSQGFALGAARQAYYLRVIRSHHSQVEVDFKWREFLQSLKPEKKERNVHEEIMFKIIEANRLGAVGYRVQKTIIADEKIKHEYKSLKQAEIQRWLSIKTIPPKPSGERSLADEIINASDYANKLGIRGAKITKLDFGPTGIEFECELFGQGELAELQMRQKLAHSDHQTALASKMINKRIEKSITSKRGGLDCENLSENEIDEIFEDYVKQPLELQ